jgi:hypothetical protein
MPLGSSWVTGLVRERRQAPVMRVPTTTDGSLAVAQPCGPGPGSCRPRRCGMPASASTPVRRRSRASIAGVTAREPDIAARAYHRPSQTRPRARYRSRRHRETQRRRRRRPPGLAHRQTQGSRRAWLATRIVGVAGSSGSLRRSLPAFSGTYRQECLSRTGIAGYPPTSAAVRRRPWCRECPANPRLLTPASAAASVIAPTRSPVRVRPAPSP